jgi:carbon monoxide dehydrogenase subunit G
MELHDEFVVSLPVAGAWEVLTDVEKIAPCLPGIWLREVTGDEYQGVVKIKLGQLTASYEGVARYLLRDADVYKAVLKAEGHEIHGQGRGTALVTATLAPSAEGTKVDIVTVLSIDGRLAHIADRMMADMSSRLIAAFVENLQMTVLGEPQPFGAPPALPIESDEDPPEPKFEKVTELRSRSERPAPKLEPAGTHPLMVRPSGQRELLARRLAPYLSVAGFLFIVRIVVYSLRRRHRSGGTTRSPLPGSP